MGICKYYGVGRRREENGEKSKLRVVWAFQKQGEKWRNFSSWN